MTLFASLSSSAETEAFSKRESTYNDINGKLDALRVQANSRPVPRPLSSRVLRTGPDPSTDPNNIEVLAAPTPHILITLPKPV